MPRSPGVPTGESNPSMNRTDRRSDSAGQPLANRADCGATREKCEPHPWGATSTQKAAQKVMGRQGQPTKSDSDRDQSGAGG